ncbi:mandelate racemase/muconate lactonizing enzyme family protein [Spirosoma validum]|uniref:Mandelate racemase/muconate lactonizing enzyme family protein n=1 Tax=Spirosoma validum TaxID=2771355 RepID=A0A927B266_9BACT|nr:mandelate racemase/muconate lactonizing enzyme family protein [Spirosoma validum]MBD2753976.1 mandelate racemase/muconate lactonizing enzyme family protein [Spirosoma validum]
MNRRQFLQTTGAVAGLPLLHPSPNQAHRSKTLRINRTNANFEREPLIRQFGFKGNFMHECWQSASLVETESGLRKIGLATQNVLYDDADVYSLYSEAGANALLFSLTDQALRMMRDVPFQTPIDLMDQLLEPIHKAGIQLTNRPALNKLFTLNALVGPDNAAWLLYAAENGYRTFDELIPQPYRTALGYRNKRIAILYSASYSLPIADIRRAVEQQGYFVVKIKLGQPGTQAEMLEKDKQRLTEIHTALKNLTTPQTPSGRIIYTLDPNARYERKETLLRLLDHTKKIGAFDQILLIEEPLFETNEELVGDVGVRLCADESAHDYEGAVRRLDQGYQALVLKGIAKTLSQSMKMAKTAHERGIPCLCADLTVNPILIDWNKNLAARLKPFPGLDMQLLEANGDLNYRNWQTMVGYHPRGTASWTRAKQGVFELDDTFYAESGGILQPSAHYKAMFR